ncbi:hypothetical protein BDV10DRAFT_163182 [Aspergillus recurvatus]
MIAMLKVLRGIVTGAYAYSHDNPEPIPKSITTTISGNSNSDSDEKQRIRTVRIEWAVVFAFDFPSQPLATLSASESTWSKHSA